MPFLNHGDRRASRRRYAGRRSQVSDLPGRRSSSGDMIDGSLASGPKIENRYIQRPGGAYRIKILPSKCDLAIRDSQKDHIILPIHTARRLNEPLPLYLSHCALHIVQVIHLELEKAEVHHSTDEPGSMTDRFLPPR